MKKCKWFHVFTLFSLVVLLAACQNPLTLLLGDGEEMDVSIIINHEEHVQDTLRETVLYYRDEKGMLIPVMKKIPWEEGIARGALQKLVDEEFLREDLETVGLLPVLPADTKILGISVNDGLSKVDFNENLLNYETEIEESAIVQSIVYTLTEFEAIDRVQIMVNGEILNQLKFGTKVDQPLKRENINLSGVIDDTNIPVVVYYKSTINGMDSYYVPVTKRIHGIKVDIKSALVAQLEGAPEGSGLYSELPEGVLVNDVFVKDGIAYIDFTEEIRRMPSNVALQQSLVYELGFTLKEIEPSIAQIRILSNGTEIPLASGVSLNLPQYSNPF